MNLQDKYIVIFNDDCYIISKISQQNLNKYKFNLINTSKELHYNYICLEKYNYDEKKLIFSKD